MGILVTITSVGAGAIGVTVLLLLHPKMPAKRVVGSGTASYAARGRMLLDYRMIYDPRPIGFIRLIHYPPVSFDPFRPAGEGMVGLIAHAA
jgi:hypothetical protein